MKDLSLLAVRVVTGGLLAGHGAQKLFGSFGGPGPQGTAGWLESIGLRPGHRWAPLAGGSEFFGGLLTAIGLGGPIGPIMVLGPMGMATAKVHWGKPIWVTEGGAELPLTNAAVAVAVALSGPGAISLDHLFGIRVPKPLVALTLAGTVAGLAYGLLMRPPAQRPQQAEEEKPPQEEEAPLRATA